MSRNAQIPNLLSDRSCNKENLNNNLTSNLLCWQKFLSFGKSGHNCVLTDKWNNSLVCINVKKKGKNLSVFCSAKGEWPAKCVCNKSYRLCDSIDNRKFAQTCNKSFYILKGLSGIAYVSCLILIMFFSHMTLTNIAALDFVAERF